MLVEEVPAVVGLNAVQLHAELKMHLRPLKLSSNRNRAADLVVDVLPS